MEEALEGNHILVRFPKPQALTLTVDSGKGHGDKTYEVSEFSVPTAVSSGSPIARVGDKYFMFGKWDPKNHLITSEMSLESVSSPMPNSPLHLIRPID